MTMFAFFFYQTFSQLNYSAVIDCGTSSTDLFIFSFNTTEKHPIPHLYNKTSFSQALHYAISNITIAHQIFNDVMVKVKDVIKNETDRNRTKITLYGTSGMRKLPEELSSPIYQEMFDICQKNYIGFSCGNFSNISPDTEAKFTWVTVNVIQQNFGDKVNLLPVIGLSGGNSYIVLPNVGEEKFKVYGTEYTFQVITFKNLGINDVPLNHTLEIARRESKLEIESGCFPSGYTRKEVTTTRGTSNYTDCLENLKKYTFSYLPKKDSSDYSIDGIKISPISSTVVLVGQYYVDTVMNESMQNYSLAQIGAFADSFCKKTYNELKASYSNVGDEFLTRDCLQFAYQVGFLQKAARLSDSKNKYHRLLPNAENEIGWQMGSVLALMLDEDLSLMMLIIGIVIVLIIVILLILLIVFIVYRYKKKKREKELEENAYIDRDLDLGEFEEVEVREVDITSLLNAPGEEEEDQ